MFLVHDLFITQLLHVLPEQFLGHLRAEQIHIVSKIGLGVELLLVHLPQRLGVGDVVLEQVLVRLRGHVQNLLPCLDGLLVLQHFRFRLRLVDHVRQRHERQLHVNVLLGRRFNEGEAPFELFLVEHALHSLDVALVGFVVFRRRQHQRFLRLEGIAEDAGDEFDLFVNRAMLHLADVKAADETVYSDLALGDDLLLVVGLHA